MKFSLRKCVWLTGALFAVVWLNACSLSRLTCCNCLFLGRETAAIASLRTVHNSQAQYQKKYNHFGTLKELAEAGLISSNYLNEQPVSYYVYADLEVFPDAYCVSATRASHGWRFWLWWEDSAYRDFVVCEDGTIRGHAAKTIHQLQRGEGQPISESPAP